MSVSLTDQIRQFAEYVDESQGSIDIDRLRERRAGTRPVGSARPVAPRALHPLPIIVGAAALALLVIGAVALWVRGTGGDEASVATTVPGTTIPGEATGSTSSTTLPADAYPGDWLRLTGFSGYQVAGGGWQGVVGIENQSSQTIVIDTGEIVIDTGEIVFKDASGDVIVTGRTEPRRFFQRILYPGVNYLGVHVFESTSAPASIEINYHEAEFLDAGRLTVSDVAVEVGSDEIPGVVTGEITSSFEQAKRVPELLFVFFDADGNPLFGLLDWMWGVDVEPTGTTPLDHSFGPGLPELLDGAPAWDHVEVHAHPSAWDPSPTRDRFELTRPLSTVSEASGEHPGDWLRLDGFSGYQRDGVGWQGVVWIENQSSQTIVIDTGEIVFKDASGAVIDTNFVLQRIFYPGVNYLGVQVFEPTSAPASIEISYHEAEFLDSGRFTVSNVVVEATNGRLEDVLFEIAHDFADAKEPELLFVFFNSDGDPLFGVLADAGAVDPTSTRLGYGFSVDGAPDWDHVEVHAHPSVYDPSPQRDRVDLTRRLVAVG